MSCIQRQKPVLQATTTFLLFFCVCASSIACNCRDTCLTYKILNSRVVQCHPPGSSQPKESQLKARIFRAAQGHTSGQLILQGIDPRTSLIFWGGAGPHTQPSLQNEGWTRTHAQRVVQGHTPRLHPPRRFAQDRKDVWVVQGHTPGSSLQGKASPSLLEWVVQGHTPGHSIQGRASPSLL